MHAVILAAGRGTRMQPLTDIAPKPMLPVCGQPLAAHVADAAVAAGASELVFVVGYLEDQVREYFGESYGGLPVTYVVQADVTGTASAVRAARSAIDGEFAVLNGDTVLDPESVVALFEHDAAVAVHPVDDPREYGVVSERDGIITDIVEKPTNPPSNLANAGAYTFPGEVRERLDVAESERGEYELTDVVAELCERQPVRAVETRRWLDVARPADLIRANELVLGDCAPTVAGTASGDAVVEGVVVVEEGASIAAEATVRGPAFVGRNAVIGQGAVVQGPAAIGANATVGANAEVSKSVVFPGGDVGEDVRLHDVVLGPQCQLSRETHLAGLSDESGNGTASFVAADGGLDGGLRY